MKREGVALVIADLGSGGAQQVLTRLANHWAGAGRRVAVVTLSPAESDFFELDPLVARISLGGIADTAALAAKITANLRRIVRLRRALAAFRGQTAVGFIGPTNVTLRLASLGLGYRVVLSERNDPARQSFGRLWDALRRLVYRRADIVTANSAGALESLAAHVPRRKLRHLPNPLRDFPERVPPAGERERVFLNVGRLHRQKGQDLIVRAFAEIAPKLPDWRLVIVGEGAARHALETLADAHGIGARVELPGQVADPFDWYRSAGVFVFPSRWEGSPNALMEAMACALPAVVADTSPGLTELVRDGQEGLVVPGEDVAGLAAAMQRLARNDEERTTLGLNARARAERFRPERVLAEWEAVLWPGPRARSGSP